jgi:hypothetical protein
MLDTNDETGYMGRTLMHTYHINNHYKNVFIFLHNEKNSSCLYHQMRGKMATLERQGRLWQTVRR